jgi:uncharacterized protein YdaU (DUF1376 family)
VNSYPHHIGDYSKDTAHLTMLEDAAYRRMLDVVYASEKPLPRDQQKIYRLVRARSHVEKLAVDVVLGEFWNEGDDGWHNKRADEEIAKALELGEDSKLKKDNELERQRRHRERRKALFEQLRTHGIVPKWDTPMDDLERLLSRACNAPVTRDEPSPETDLRRLTNSQEPIAKNQEKKRAEATRGSRLPSGWFPGDVLKAWAEKERPDLDLNRVVAKFRDHWISKPGNAGLKLDWDATFRNWVREERSGNRPPPLLVDL